MNDMERFQGYSELAELLIGSATREQLIDLAQVLAVHGCRDRHRRTTPR
jgi:hypothetical protein